MTKREQKELLYINAVGAILALTEEEEDKLLHKVFGEIKEDSE